MAVGAVILAGYCEIGGYVAAIWLIGIAVNLITTGQYSDVAVRDVALAVAAFTLARLTESGVEVEAFGRGLGSTAIFPKLHSPSVPPAVDSAACTGRDGAAARHRAVLFRSTTDRRAA